MEVYATETGVLEKWDLVNCRIYDLLVKKEIGKDKRGWLLSLWVVDWI